MMDSGHEGALTALQIAVLRVFWAHGALTTTEVHGYLSKERDLAPTTVATLVTRLWRRGLLRRGGDKRPFVYECTRSEAELQSEGIEELKERVFAGDFNAMIEGLLRSETSSPEELAEIKKLIRRRERELRRKNDA